MATATYPPAPPYYKLYKDYLQNPDSAPKPPPPVQGTSVLYGANYTTDDVLPTLEEQGVRQLYPKRPSVGDEEKHKGFCKRRSAATFDQVAYFCKFCTVIGLEAIFSWANTNDQLQNVLND